MRKQRSACCRCRRCRWARASSAWQAAPLQAVKRRLQAESLRKGVVLRSLCNTGKWRGSEAAASEVKASEAEAEASPKARCMKSSHCCDHRCATCKHNAPPQTCAEPVHQDSEKGHERREVQDTPGMLDTPGTARRRHPSMSTKPAAQARAGACTFRTHKQVSTSWQGTGHLWLLPNPF